MSTAEKSALIAIVAVCVILILITLLRVFVTKKLVEIAMDRKAPKIIEKSLTKIAGSEYMAPIIERVNAAGERLLSLPTESVSIKAFDGINLVGHFYACENPERVIVAMHGWRSSWLNDFGIISEFWHNNNCCVLYAEQRAQGASDGDYMCFGLKERYDCLSWINWVNERTGADLPVYIGGLSMGATTVLMAAGLDLPTNVRGVMADCGFSSMNGIWEHIVKKNLHLPYGRLEEAVASRISKRKSGLMPREYSTEDAMRVCRLPVLFIHGTEDKFVPLDMTYRNYEACNSEKRMLIVPGAEHGMSYIQDKNAYEESALDFWREFDSLTHSTDEESKLCTESENSEVLLNRDTQ